VAKCILSIGEWVLLELHLLFAGKKVNFPTCLTSGYLDFIICPYTNPAEDGAKCHVGTGNVYDI